MFVDSTNDIALSSNLGREQSPTVSTASSPLSPQVIYIQVEAETPAAKAESRPDRLSLPPALRAARPTAVRPVPAHLSATEESMPESTERWWGINE